MPAQDDDEPCPWCQCPPEKYDGHACDEYPPQPEHCHHEWVLGNDDCIHRCGTRWSELHPDHPDMLLDPEPGWEGKTVTARALERSAEELRALADWVRGVRTTHYIIDKFMARLCLLVTFAAGMAIGALVMVLAIFG
jgi:hypothetical protein